MDDRCNSHRSRYIALALFGVILAALLFPTLDGLSVAGFLGDKTYLVILQDNDEIRPTGGLMGFLGLITLHNGNIVSAQYHSEKSFTSAGTYNSSWNGIVQLDGPESFTKFFGVNAVLLSDSNVQYDFASFAPKMQSDFYNVTGNKVDGIIAVDFTAVEAVLSITGPITASGEVITSRNVADRLHAYNSAEETTLLSAFTSDLSRLVRDASVTQKLALYTTLQTLESEKHVLIYPNQGFWSRGAVDAAVSERTPPTDFVSVVDATLGTGKADFGVTRTIDYHVKLLSDGSAVSTLTLNYTNGCWWDYDVFSTALVPPGAQLLAVQNATHAFKGPEVTSGEGSTAFSSRLLISANTTGSVTYTYKIANVSSGSGIGNHYDLYIQKQAGINRYILNANVDLPPGATVIHAENVGSNQVFEGDAHVSVVYK